MLEKNILKSRKNYNSCYYFMKARKMGIKTAMEVKLRSTFSPTYLELTDDSQHHAGHLGNPTGKAETHIGIIIVSEFFVGKTRLERARLVHNLLAEEIKMIHAITTLKTLTIAEYENYTK
jgi:BolA protein